MLLQGAEATWVSCELSPSAVHGCLTAARILSVSTLRLITLRREGACNVLLK